jgi:hypothetical protein
MRTFKNGRYIILSNLYYVNFTKYKMNKFCQIVFINGLEIYKPKAAVDASIGRTWLFGSY